MSGHVGRQLRLSASRGRTFHPQNRLCSQHEQTLFASPRIKIHAPGAKRDFSFQATTEGLLNVSHSLITNIHGITGAPWFVTLPLVALTVTIAVRGPFVIYDQRLAQRRAKLAALIQAQYSQIGQTIRRQNLSDNKIRTATRREAETGAKRLYKNWGVQPWKSMIGGAVGIPILVANLETIRRMCGGPRGILGTLMYGVEESGKDAVVEAAVAAAPVTTTPVEAVSTDLVDGATGVGDIASTTSDLIASITESTMATGGTLWFPDLLVPDPYHILPFLLGTTFLITLLPKSMLGVRALFVPAPPNSTAAMRGSSARRGFQRGMVVASLAMGFVTINMPAALHVYWISSIAFNALVRSGLQVVMPVPKFPIKPCRGHEMPLRRPRPSEATRK